MFEVMTVTFYTQGTTNHLNTPVMLHNVSNAAIILELLKRSDYSHRKTLLCLHNCTIVVHDPIHRNLVSLNTKKKPTNIFDYQD